MRRHAVTLVWDGHDPPPLFPCSRGLTADALGRVGMIAGGGAGLRTILCHEDPHFPTQWGGMLVRGALCGCGRRAPHVRWWPIVLFLWQQTPFLLRQFPHAAARQKQRCAGMGRLSF